MASTQINYTQTTPTNAIKYTLSMWAKRSNTFAGDSNYLASVWVDGNNHWCMRFNDDQLNIYDYVSSSVTTELKTNRKFRDCSAWYHIVYVYDSANGTAGNRQRIYVNGVEETSFATDTNPSSSAASLLNVSGRVLTIGARNSASYFDGVMSHIQFVDGLALAPTEFGETDATTGEWKIKASAYTTPGNNGFFLKFENSANLDLDSSSNAHTFTTTGSLIQTEDNPDNNFPTWNPLNHDYANTNSVISKINNYAQAGANGAYNQAVSTMAITRGSGKWYFECKYVANDGNVGGIGIIDMDGQSEAFYQNRNLSSNSTATNIGRCVYYANGYSVIPGTQNTSYGGTWSTGDIIGMAVDSDNGAVYFSKQGVWQNSGDPTSGATKTGAIDISGASWWTGAQFFGIYCGDNSSSGNDSFAANFGNGYFQTTPVATAQSDDGSLGLFEYDVPTGYRALCTKNLATYG